MKTAALEFIRRVLASPGCRPAVLWSSGKDSMALLHLVRQVQPQIPVILLREPYQPYRYAFAERIIAEWQLNEVHDLIPNASHVCTRNGVTRLIHSYRFGEHTLKLPVDLIELDGQPWVCGLDVLGRPKGVSQTPWNLLLSGARSADADMLLGHMPLAAHVIKQPNFPEAAFPLRDWSDADLWAYLENEQVPVQENRYERAVDGWRERADKRGNPDYLAGCVRCLEPGKDQTVSCPQYGTVNRVADTVARTDNPLPFYIQPN